MRQIMALSHIYKDYLTANGVNKDNIISIDFDKDENRHDFNILDYNAVKQYLYSHIEKEKESYYIFLDEIQELDNFERLVNGLNSLDNVDVYVTGSNSRFLSGDIRTIFRGFLVRRACHISGVKVHAGRSCRLIPERLASFEGRLSAEINQLQK